VLEGRDGPSASEACHLCGAARLRVPAHSGGSDQAMNSVVWVRVTGTEPRLPRLSVFQRNVPAAVGPAPNIIVFAVGDARLLLVGKVHPLVRTPAVKSSQVAATALPPIPRNSARIIEPGTAAAIAWAVFLKTRRRSHPPP
jgi:hypothetical protein